MQLYYTNLDNKINQLVMFLNHLFASIYIISAVLSIHNVLYQFTTKGTVLVFLKVNRLSNDTKLESLVLKIREKDFVYFLIFYYFIYISQAIKLI